MKTTILESTSLLSGAATLESGWSTAEVKHPAIQEGASVEIKLENGEDQTSPGDHEVRNGFVNFNFEGSPNDDQNFVFTITK